MRAMPEHVERQVNRAYDGLAAMNLHKRHPNDAFDWWECEESLDYNIGVPDFRNRPAFIGIISAARVLCGTYSSRGLYTTFNLLRAVLTELEERIEEEEAKEERRDIRVPEKRPARLLRD